MVADEWEVIAVRYGTRATNRASTYLNFHSYGEPDGPVTMDYFFWVVRNERTFLVDCGFRPAVGLRRGRTVLCEPVDAIARLGIGHDDIEAMIVTHAHYDHIGNLDQFADTPLIISQRELDFWMSPLSRRTQFLDSSEELELQVLANAYGEGRVTGFGEAHQVAPGLQLVTVGGHTPGQALLRVNTAAGEVIVTSDVVHFYEEYERDWPFTVASSLEEVYRGYDLVRAMTAERGGVLVPGHDPEVMRRFERLDSELGDLAVKVG